ncbi:MAG: NADH-quinone oxidoreductase subunit N, partial [Planctomycetaceae bacterium]|nr:NADH-quinone oxidoreductase subunit N [Planctomycetaceae bacterium]
MLVEWKTIVLLWPEVILIAAASSIFVGGAFTRSRAYWAAVAVLSYLVAAAALAGVGSSGIDSPWTAVSPWMTTSIVTGPVTIDAMSLGLRWVALAMGLIFTLAASRLADRELASELLGSLMLVTVGVMLTASANELVLLFLGLELISIPTYVLLFLGRRDRASAEATMKYFFLSIFSSALLLYGFSLVYGLAGTTVIAGSEETRGIREVIAGLVNQPSSLAALAPLALVLLVAGFGFKLAAAPLQFYAPDVYQGTTNLNAGLLAVAPKIAGVAGLIRLALVTIPAAGEFGWQLALVLSVLTMTIGNVCALWQGNIRRLLAYSSIAHGGYLLIGLAAAAAAPLTASGIAALLLYVAVYAVATMGSFAALAYLGSSRREVNGVEELAGLGRTQPLVAGAMALFMFSLAGIPPLAGFWGKLTLFGSAIQVAAAETTGPLAVWFTLLVVLGVLNAAVAAAYYLRIVAVMYFQPASAQPPAAGGWGALAATLACSALVVGIGVFPRPAVDAATAAQSTLQSRGPVVV